MLEHTQGFQLSITSMFSQGFLVNLHLVQQFLNTEGGKWSTMVEEKGSNV